VHLQYRPALHLLWIVLLVAMFACCFFQVFTNMSVYYKQGLGFTEPFIGLLMSCNGILIVAIEMVLIYKLEGKRRSTYYIVIGVFLVGLAYLMLNLFSMNHVLAFVMIIIITFGEISSMPFMNSFWISRTQSYNRGQYAALYTMAWSAAQTLGPMTGAQVAGHAGFNWLWWSVAGLSFITSFAFFKLHRHMGQEKLVLTESDITTTPAPEL